MSSKKEKKKKDQSSQKPGKLCLNCHKEPFNLEKNKERLCVTCLRKLTRTNCFHCQKSFHLLAKNQKLPKEKHVCDHCAADKTVHGEPKKCKICENFNAFASDTCRNCEKSQKLLGDPVPCERCNKKCAFNLMEKSKAKVGGKVLCYLCTQNVKLEVKKAGGKKSDDLIKQLRAQPVLRDPVADPKKDKKSSILQALSSDQNKPSALDKPATHLKPIVDAMSENVHWETLTEKFEVLQKAFLEHKEQSETQTQQYIRKIFELRKQLTEVQEAKDRAVTKALEREKEVGSLKGTITQLEQLHHTSLAQAKEHQSERELIHTREIAELNKQIKFLEYVTPQEKLQTAKMKDPSASAFVSKSSDAFFGTSVDVATAAVAPARLKRAIRTETDDAKGESPKKKALKRKGGKDKDDSDPKRSKLTKAEKKLLSKDERRQLKAEKRERKRLKKEEKDRKRGEGGGEEGVTEGQEGATEGQAQEAGEQEEKTQEGGEGEQEEGAEAEDAPAENADEAEAEQEEQKEGKPEKDEEEEEKVGGKNTEDGEKEEKELKTEEDGNEKPDDKPEKEDTDKKTEDETADKGETDENSEETGGGKKETEEKAEKEEEGGATRSEEAGEKAENEPEHETAESTEKHVTPGGRLKR